MKLKRKVAPLVLPFLSLWGRGIVYVSPAGVWQTSTAHTGPGWEREGISPQAAHTEPGWEAGVRQTVWRLNGWRVE